MAGLSAMDGMEAALAAAARRYVAGKRRAEAASRDRLETAALFRRLGLAGADLAAVEAAGRAEELPPALAAVLRERLAAELQGLARQARGGDPRYDINRHMALRRAAAWVDGRARPGLPANADERSSGAALNGRFRRRGGRRTAA